MEQPQPEIEEARRLSWSDLPGEIIMEILVRVPGRFRTQLKCVNKSLLSLMEKPGFAREILDKINNSVDDKDKYRGLVLSEENNNGGYNRVRSVGLSRGGDVSLGEFGLPAEDNPLRRKTLHLFNSCHGLVCVAYQGLLYVWNPTTRECREVTPVRAPRCLHLVANLHVFAIGYDPVSDDYKIVEAPRMYYKCPNKQLLKVFSLKNNCWRHVKEFPDRSFPYTISYGTHATTINEIAHWDATEKISMIQRKKRIVYFDFTKEEMGTLPLPYDEDDDYDDCMMTSLAAFSGCLSMIHYNGVTHDLWIMEEYGVKESWMKLFTIDNLFVEDLRHALIPLCWMGDEIVLGVEGEPFLIYDPIERTHRRLELCGVNPRSTIIPLLDTLISPNATTTTAN
ncbi:hypothetical protein CCACVL1_27669 [Corchorus capsularis]|uniref:F-box associated beta-propeller type 1 domain-containing protein n=1 Tax=Corchorus capsularis TaxID=210143 RepID=A0A1R3G9B4_COCAP|nr:hypothetical protein CCACVL1_27669 [Corchorus capsularis]